MLLPRRVPGIRDRVERFLPGTPVLQPGDVVAAADLVLLTVPDDALGGLVRAVWPRPAPRWPAACSRTPAAGTAWPSSQPAAELGALPLALHPVMTFTGRPDDADRLAGICFGVTAPEVLRPAAEVLVMEMGGEPVFIAEADRGLYHAALAGAANHLVTQVVQAADLLTRAGVAQPARMLGPLLSAALDNALRLGDAALTGPVARGDAETVAGHRRRASRRLRPRRCPPISRWPGSPLPGRWPAGCSAHRTRSDCWTCSPRHAR